LEIRKNSHQIMERGRRKTRDLPPKKSDIILLQDSEGTDKNRRRQQIVSKTDKNTKNELRRESKNQKIKPPTSENTNTGKAGIGMRKWREIRRRKGAREKCTKTRQNVNKKGSHVGHTKNTRQINKKPGAIEKQKKEPKKTDIDRSKRAGAKQSGILCTLACAPPLSNKNTDTG
jgi:hypothetical protein